MVDMILSIKPKYANLILNGRKKFEFRKINPIKRVDKVYIYSSSPEQKIIGYFKYSTIIKDSPQNIWKRFGNESGLDKKEFFTYCKTSKTIYCFIISSIKRFNPVINPYSLRTKFKPPQNFIYVLDKKHSWLNRKIDEFY